MGDNVNANTSGSAPAALYVFLCFLFEVILHFLCIVLAIDLISISTILVDHMISVMFVFSDINYL